MNERQMCSTKIRHFDQIEAYLDGFGDTKKETDGRPYYLKIDHCQIAPTNKQGDYLIVTIYHVEYLKKGVSKRGN